ncbi:hypothetical protein Q672_09775 [Marinobacter sp. EVN1]|jgi:hypothetical protein|uniref:Uncharacterized protein n=1 Tax=Marinobacter nauticus TaxID=2743 RepID=A0A833JRT2_MARNT|nr:hypothetical protein Q672_09775 [Marinobacter sp. EVN1]ERS90416.1 hypothetical protein Q667_09350 [Marinobacter sp. C1S70]KAE8546867.1 hypothetical protein F6453_0547 [Marinobacter nauticus]RBP71847.1 hypothetical protein DET64_10892 [Marinobacter nauticus]
MIIRTKTPFSIFAMIPRQNVKHDVNNDTRKSFL